MPQCRHGALGEQAIRGVHSDNGTEYVNHRVARLLDKLAIEFTKSRARRSNDNAFVEGKNASVVCKQLGYSHIPSRLAGRVIAFTTAIVARQLP